jgi:hypothetical protein
MAHKLVHEDYIRLLAEHFDLKTLFNFRLCSKYFKDSSDALFYRHLSLHDKTCGEGQTVFINTIIKRILDPNDRLRYYVRSLKIGPFHDDEHLPQVFHDIPDMEQLLGSFSNLQDFYWNVCSKIPLQILATLHQQWPRCHLHVKQPRRYEAELDEAMISSPLLVSLETPVFMNGTNYPYISDWPALTELLTRHGSLKTFRPHFYHVRGWTSGGPGPLHFHLGPSTKLPVLEDFTIPIEYDADQRHVTVLLQAMSCASLRRLTFIYTQAFLIKGLTGQIPQLKSLVMTFQYSENMKGRLGAKAATWIEFFKSIDSLEELSVGFPDSLEGRGVWPAIFPSHGPSLRKVRLIEPFTEGQIDIMIAQAPAIEELSFELSMAPTAGWVMYPGRWSWVSVPSISRK